MAVGPPVVVGTLVVVVVAFSNPTFQRLLIEDDISISISIFGGGGSGNSHEVEEHERLVHLEHYEW